MRHRLPFPLLLAALGLLALASPPLPAEPDEPVPFPTASVTIEKLEAKIAETEADSKLGDEVKKQRLDLYNKALDNLNAADTNIQATESYARTIDEAPARIEAQREALVTLQNRASTVDLDAAPTEPLPQLDQRLQKEKADLASLQAQRSDADNRLAELSARPALIRQRLPLARQQQEELASQLKLPPPDGEDPAIREARQWELESRSAS